MNTITVYNFRLINREDGNQEIDTNSVTYADTLTPLELAEYEEVALRLYTMERFKKKQAKQMEQERKNKTSFIKRLIRKVA